MIKYSLYLWKNEYVGYQKIIGMGFEYLNRFGQRFNFKPILNRSYNYPHNPIISSFLYSGILGGGMYVIYIISSLFLYIKKSKQFGAFVYMYIVILYFMMFSGNSHFSVPIFTFFSGLSFLRSN